MLPNLIIKFVLHKILDVINYFNCNVEIKLCLVGGNDTGWKYVQRQVVCSYIQSWCIRFAIHSIGNLCLVIPNNKTLEHWRLKNYCNVVMNLDEFKSYTVNGTTTIYICICLTPKPTGQSPGTKSQCNTNELRSPEFPFITLNVFTRQLSS